MIIKQFSIYSFGSAAIRAPEYSECLIPNEYFGKIFFVTYTLNFYEKTEIYLSRSIRRTYLFWSIRTRSRLPRWIGRQFISSGHRILRLFVFVCRGFCHFVCSWSRCLNKKWSRLVSKCCTYQLRHQLLPGYVSQRISDEQIQIYLGQIFSEWANIWLWTHSISRCHWLWNRASR